jgi:dsRNA-specific ribonuclease
MKHEKNSNMLRIIHQQKIFFHFYESILGGFVLNNQTSRNRQFIYTDSKLVI